VSTLSIPPPRPRRAQSGSPSAQPPARRSPSGNRLGGGAGAISAAIGSGLAGVAGAPWPVVAAGTGLALIISVLPQDSSDRLQFLLAVLDHLRWRSECRDRRRRAGAKSSR
jgi:hypothetical protein